MSELILELVRQRLHGGELKHASSAKGGEWCGPCPVCGGDDRFRVWPNQDGGQMAQKAGVSGTWWCRHCNQQGDVIDLMEFTDHLTFPAACKELRIELDESGRRLRRPLSLPRQEKKWHPKECSLPSDKWMAHATKLAREAHEQLLGNEGVLLYLASRGLPLEAVKKYGLGYLEGEDKTGKCLYRAQSAFDLPDRKNDNGTKTRPRSLWIPRGITIPQWSPGWNDQQCVHRVRIRRRAADLQEKDPKYLMLTGSAQAPLVLPPDFDNPAMTVWVVVEAELDAYAVHHACGGKVGVIAIMTNMAKPDAALHALLLQAPLILVALDFDKPDNKGKRPGYQGWLWWHETYQKAKRWPVPAGKDPGDARKFGYSLAEWIDAGLPQPLSFLRAGSLGAASNGMCSQGGGEIHDNSPVDPMKREAANKPAAASHNRWKGADGNNLSGAALPPHCSYSLDYLRHYFAEKEVTPDLLIPCPITRPEAWYWVYYSACLKCRGHYHCLLDFVLSPQMLAPETAAAENRHV